MNGGNDDEWSKCCPVYIELPANRSGNKMRRLKGGKVWAGEEFEMIATFDDHDFPCVCRCCEYRQYVRGTVKINGVKQNHPLVDGNLHPAKWREDAIRRQQDILRYGHRGDMNSTWDDYPPIRAIGCAYKGKDAPGVIDWPGNSFDIDLYFKGEIVDVCRNGAVVERRYWRVNYSGVLKR